MNIKKTIYTIITIVIAIAFLILVGLAYNKYFNPAKVQQNHTAIIGSILPLTGEAANYGTGLKKGMDLAVKLINGDSLNAMKLQIIYEDDKGQPSIGVTAYNKLKTINRVNYIIGSMFSNVTLALAPMAEKDSLVLMSPTASAVELSKYGDHVFRIYPSDTYDGNFLAEFVANQMKKKQVAIVSVEAASTVEISNIFASSFKALGGEITSSSTYKQGEKNYRNIIQNLKANIAEVVFIPGYVDDIAVFLKQAKELNLNKIFIGISTLYDKKIIELAGISSEGLIFSAPVFDINNSNPENKKFVDAFKKEYGAEPDILAAYGYDVVNISYKAISESSDNEVSSYIADLYKIEQYPGVTGNTTFDKNGDVIKQMKVLTIKDGKFTDY